MYPMRRSIQRGQFLLASSLLALVGALMVTGSAFAAGDANQGKCPNEQLRAENHSTALPDCRAYELVTPAFKFGQFPATAHVAPNGTSVQFSNLGAFGDAGDDATTGGPVYRASRGGSAWSSEALETDDSEFLNPESANSFSDTSADLSTILMRRTPVSAKAIDSRIYLRSSADEAPVEVGPEIAPERVRAWTEKTLPEIQYMGASPDLSHVLFNVARGTTTDFLWPGDTTVGFRSLYEYVGTHNLMPSLVGVTGGAGSMDLISHCGTVLGAGNVERASVDVYGAISAGAPPEPGVASEEGAKIFFTATKGGCSGYTPAGEATTGTGPPVNEIYARVNGARTVSISEPSPEACSECSLGQIHSGSLTEEEADALNATFQGASSDGTKVFFLSKQALLPGAEGVNLYEYDFDAEPGRMVTLVATQMPESGRQQQLEAGPGAGVVRVAPDGSRVYFVSEDTKLADNKDAKGESAAEASEAGEGRLDLYVFNTTTHRYAFLAPLSESDSADWKVEDSGRPAEVTPDGRYLLFASRHDLTPDALGTGEQLYRADAAAGEANAAAEEAGQPGTAASLGRITVGAAGFNQNGNAAEYAHIAAQNYSATDFAAPQAVSMTDDGSEIFFQSPWALTPTALNDVCLVGYEAEGACMPGAPTAENVYEWKDGTVSLLSDGRDRNSVLGGAESSAVSLIGSDGSGSDVFFTTADALVPADHDTAADIYDAREDGGFTEEGKAAACEGEQCQGALGSPPPVFGPPASLGLSATGNLVPAASAKPKPKSKPLTRAQMLARALEACRTKDKRQKKKRSSCERRARKSYGGKK
jgi:hypothetical protein